MSADTPNVKKAYQDIVAHLEANKDRKVSTVLPDIIALCAPKSKGATGAKTFLKSVEGDVLGIFDYYFKRWMPVVGDAAVEFGAKAGSATGLTNMCKEGTSLWTKQQRAAKNAVSELLDRVEKGEIAASALKEERERIEAARGEVVETELGFETKEELLEYLADAGFEAADS